MRNHRTIVFLVTAGLGLALIPFSAWLARGVVGGPPARTVRSAAALGPEVPPLSTEAHPAEGQLLIQAERSAEARAAAERAAALAARQARLERLAAQRAARQAASPPPAPVPAPAPASAVPDDVWARLRQCESGGRYDINTGNGYYGAYQFKLSTWRGLGYSGYPHHAPPAIQDEAARKLQARSGWGQWPACSRRLGLR